MSTINTAITSNPFINNFANSGDINDLQRALSESFNCIDNNAEGRRDDTVGFSSKAQFMLNLQTYAFSLSDEERYQFVDVLEQSDDEMFDEKFQNKRITDSIEKAEKQIHQLPQYEDILQEEIRAKEESVEINKKLQESVSHSENGLLGNEKYFQMLIDNADFIDKNMTIAPDLFKLIGKDGLVNENKTIPEMFEHYKAQYEAFERRYLEKDWTVEKQSLDDPVLDQAFEAAHELTNQYILAINTYMANAGQA